MLRQHYLGHTSWEAVGPEKRSVRKDEFWPYSSSQEGWALERAKQGKKSENFPRSGRKRGPGDQREKCLVTRKSQESSGNLKRKQGLRRKVKTSPKPCSFSYLNH